MDHHNELTHYWTIKLYGVERKLGFTEWQCVLASVVSGLCWFALGVSLEIISRIIPERDQSSSTGFKSLVESNIAASAYFSFLEWILPWIMIVGSITLFRKYSPIGNLFLAVIMMSSGKSIAIPLVGEAGEWLWLLSGFSLSLYGLWGFFAGTIKTLQDWYWRFANRRTEAA